MANVQGIVQRANSALSLAVRGPTTVQVAGRVTKSAAAGKF